MYFSSTQYRNTDIQSLMQNVNTILVRAYDPLYIFLFFLGSILTFKNFDYGNEYFRIFLLIYINLGFYSHILINTCLQIQIFVKQVKISRLYRRYNNLEVSDLEYEETLNDLIFDLRYLKRLNKFLNKIYHLAAIFYLQIFYLVCCILLVKKYQDNWVWRYLITFYILKLILIKLFMKIYNNDYDY